MQLVCFSWVGFSVWEFSADAALESSRSTQTRPSLVLLVCRWRGAPAGTNEFVCVGQRSSRPSKLDQLVSVGHTCAESRVCERQTFTLCVCVSLKHQRLQAEPTNLWTHAGRCWTLIGQGRRNGHAPWRERILRSGYSWPISSGCGRVQCVCDPAVERVGLSAAVVVF